MCGADTLYLPDRMYLPHTKSQSRRKIHLIPLQSELVGMAMWQIEIKNLS